ncbi:MAG: tetratricopeptide repeat protein [Desulfovibrionaceae bacterium]|nr:tetratricopeptide repeat protein [Desulfovibrionaceae bacterium]
MSRFLSAICLILAVLAAACADPATETPETGYAQEARKLYDRARVLWNLEEKCSNPELALEYLDAAISLQPDYAEAYLRRGMAAAELRDWEEAFADSSRGIRLKPAADHYASRALIFMRQGNYLGARKDLERALRLDKNNARAKDFLRRLDKLEADEHARSPI